MAELLVCLLFFAFSRSFSAERGLIYFWISGCKTSTRQTALTHCAKRILQKEIKEAFLPKHKLQCPLFRIIQFLTAIGSKANVASFFRSFKSDKGMAFQFSFRKAERG